MSPCAADRRRTDEGRVSILVIGMVAIALTLVMGVVGLTALQISRIQLMDAADAAALDASDAIDEEAFYGGGLGDGVPLTDSSVQQAAAGHLALRPLPSRVTTWAVAEGTGTPDGRTAVVVLRAEAEIPLVSGILRGFGQSVTITVESSARSELD